MSLEPFPQFMFPLRRRDWAAIQPTLNLTRPSEDHFAEGRRSKRSDEISEPRRTVSEKRDQED